jgi:hypothetical protein
LPTLGHRTRCFGIRTPTPSAQPSRMPPSEPQCSKLEAIGPRLGAPHSSAVRGEDGSGLRELRPRAGRSRWRPIYRLVQPGIFVILAVAPEAEIDKRGFDEIVRHARRRFEKLEL